MVIKRNLKKRISSRYFIIFDGFTLKLMSFKNKIELAYKPGSVNQIKIRRSFICDACYHTTVATYPRARASHT